MKKSLKTLALACLTLIAATTIGQNINLRFTGTFTNGDYIRLDSVKVENLNRNWTEMLVYPDTVLNFNQTSISGAESSELELQSYPNPFSGKTSVRLSLPQTGNVTLQIHNLAGQKIVEEVIALNAGEHIFGITLKNAEVNLLTIKTTNGQKTIKLLNNGMAVSNAIIYNGIELAEKRLSNQNFQVGDMLKYTGYATVYGIVLTSREISQSQNESENLSLFFETPNYTLPTVTTTAASNITGRTAVSGGNVIDDGGLSILARGVCWDTIANPTINNNQITSGCSLGAFTINIAGLQPNTTYYVRAYATNAVGTVYGAQISFRTLGLPTLTTTAASNVTGTTAICGGNVIADGGATVTARGVCWSTSNNPTIAASHTTDSSGLGSFVSNITGLSTGTTYYVRAYATNDVGVAYGSQISFHTLAPPTVTTDTVSSITDTTAVCSGNVTSNGGLPIIVRGICWDTSHNPTISASYTTDSAGTGSFVGNITGLVPGITYYVRAYASNAIGTTYGNELSFTTTTYYNGGILPGVFSVGVNSHVRFSMGNLQWSAIGTHATADSTAPGTWRFAPNQWDTIGAANRNISSAYTGWIDLFDCVTSGYHNPDDSYNRNYQPYSTSNAVVYSYYNSNLGYGYGPTYYMTDPNLTGTSANYDWGVYNAISNGGNQPGMWRTLTQQEWDTLINYRTTSSGIRYAMATVNGVKGMIIVPDNWSVSTYAFNDTNS